LSTLAGEEPVQASHQTEKVVERTTIISDDVVYIRRGSKPPAGKTFTWYEDLSPEAQKQVKIYETPEEDVSVYQIIILDGKKHAVVKNGQKAPSSIAFVHDGPWLHISSDPTNCSKVFG
jgi:hypothetical protein